MATLKRTIAKKNGHARTKHAMNGHLATKFKKILKGDKRALSSAKTSINHAAREAKDRFVDMEENVQKYAKAHPWKTMGMTLLAGVVVGQIFHRK